MYIYMYTFRYRYRVYIYIYAEYRYVDRYIDARYVGFVFKGSCALATNGEPHGKSNGNWLYMKQLDFTTKPRGNKKAFNPRILV